MFKNELSLIHQSSNPTCIERLKWSNRHNCLTLSFDSFHFAFTKYIVCKRQTY